MSEFWRYFHDVLGWPQIHAAGPLQALVRGVAGALDTTRDDLVFLREQFFPAKCDPALVADFGTSRGLVRHPKENAAQFRERVVNAYKWHLLGGRTLGVPEILRFYGFDALTIDSLRRYQPSRWAEFQIGLRTPVSQREQEALLEELDTLIWLVNEYKPARSRLARIYTSTYNWLPTIWSEGPAWSEGFWSYFSGVPYPGGDGGDDIIVSFGMNYRTQSESYGALHAGIAIESLTGFLAPYIDRAVWSRSAWSDIFPRNHGFTIGEIISLHWCVRTTTSYPWRGGWNSRHWQEGATWDRVLPPWKFRFREWAKVEAVYSWPSDGAEPGERHVALHSDGTWGDINACYGRPTATTFQGTRWGDPWGADPQRHEVEILERYQQKLATATAPLETPVPHIIPTTRLGIALAPRRERGWKGAWSGPRWLGDSFRIGVTDSGGYLAETALATDPAHAVQSSTLVMPIAERTAEQPHSVGDEQLSTRSTPLHNQSWSGSYANPRRWWDYTGASRVRGISQ